MLALEGRAIAPGQGHSAGRQLLQQMVTNFTGAPMPAIGIADRGKPYWIVSDLHFSITHTSGHVFCALSDRPIGIDAEELTRVVPPALARKILSPEEYRQYKAAPDPRLALLTFWVLKEAQAKCTGEGLRIYPNHTNFSVNDPRVTEMDGCLVAVIEEEPYAL